MLEASHLRVALITIDTLEAARTLAQDLVKERLAACVTLVPGVESVYEWEGAIHQDREFLMIVKTTDARFPALESAVRARHPYATPEILALASAQVSEAYRQWVERTVSADADISAAQ
jgi:periplasmic divalent cation tolerance protein